MTSSRPSWRRAPWCCRRRRSRASATRPASRCRSSCATATAISQSCRPSPARWSRNAQSQSALQRVSSSFRSSVPQFNVEIDRVKTQTLHVPIGRGVRDAVDLSRLDLRQPVQQVRPHVPGLYPGRSGIPRHRARHRQHAGTQLERRHDPDRHRRHDHAGHRPVADQPLQPLSVLDHRRPAGAGLLAPASRCS